VLDLSFSDVRFSYTLDTSAWSGPKTGSQQINK